MCVIYNSNMDKNEIVSEEKALNQSKQMEVLLKKLINDNIIKSKSVYEAMSQVDRGDFTNTYGAYDDW
jgi:hypothetical protein